MFWKIYKDITAFISRSSIPR